MHDLTKPLVSLLIIHDHFTDTVFPVHQDKFSTALF